MRVKCISDVYRDSGLPCPDVTVGAFYTVTDLNYPVMGEDNRYELVGDSGESITAPKYLFQPLPKKGVKRTPGWTRLRVKADRVPGAVLRLVTASVPFKLVGTALCVPTTFNRKALSLVKDV